MFARTSFRRQHSPYLTYIYYYILFFLKAVFTVAVLCPRILGDLAQILFLVLLEIPRTLEAAKYLWTDANAAFTRLERFQW